MKNPDKWHPTKYELVNGQLKGSRNPAYLFVGSRLIADLFAFCYDKMIPQYVHGSVCDLGCGFAPLYLKYKDYAEQITLVDWGNTFHKNIHLDVEADLNQQLPFDDAIFDSIILSDVLEHIYEPRLLLSEIARCLRMNGKLLGNVPFCYNLHEEPYDYYRYTRYAIQRMVEDSGMKMICLCEIGSTIDCIVNIFAKRFSVSRKPLGFISEKIQKWRSKKDVNFVGNSNKLPLGYFFVAEKQ